MNSEQLNLSLNIKLEEEKLKLKKTEQAEKKLEVKNDDKIQSNKNKFDIHLNKMGKMTSDPANYMNANNKTVPAYYTEISQRFGAMENCATNERNHKTNTIVGKPSTSNVDAIKLNIANYEKTIAENNNKIVELSQSESLENFMDYDTYLVKKIVAGSETVDSPKKEYFTYRSFCKWQWDKMKESTFIIKKKL